VAGPGGDFGGRDAGVESPGDPRVAQVVGVFHQRGGELVGGERRGPDLLPDLPPGGGLDGVAGLGPEQPAVRGGAVRRDVGAELDELGRDGDLAGVRGGPALDAAFEAAVLVDLAVVGVGAACGGLASAKVWWPQPVSGRWQLALVRAATSEGRIRA
jgi:hypothetical protein